MRIRSMTRQDIDAVMAIAAALKEAPHWPRSGYEAAVDDGVWPRRIALVSEDPESRLVGFIVVVLVPPEAELESIAVDPSAQRRGVGRELLAAAIATARERPCEAMTLEVRPSNLPARALYGSLGFTEFGHRRGYYTDPPENAVLMRLSLG